MDARAVRVSQVEDEQRSVDAIYARLDAETAESVAARARLLGAPAEGPEALYARDVELARITAAVRRLRTAEQSLCFGRIDTAEGGMHIGRIGLRCRSGEPLLVDWRAEAARPFYAATIASPLGVRRRRHLRTHERSVVRVTDEILDGSAPSEADIVGDGPLASALNEARTGRMQQAAATLQREQDEIVRSEHRGIMVVDGGPGTGKTIVALHRAAYVLYAFPAVAERGVLIFGPNPRFLTYISDVLPSLGENDVQLATTTDLVGTDAVRTEQDAIARIKGRRRFADGLAQRVRARQPRGVPLPLVTAHGTVVLGPDRVDTARRSALQDGAGHNRARARFVEHVVDELVNELEQQTAKDDSDFEDELRDVLGIDLDRMFGHEETGGAPRAGLEIDWDRIRDELLEDAGIDRAVEQVWPRLRAADVVRDTLADRSALVRFFPELADDIADSIVAGAFKPWTGADLALLDEARELVDGPPERLYGHIIVDEAQLLSEMQWRMLMRRTPNRSMTIVGDLAQAGPDTTIDSWAGALEPFVGDRYVHRSLTINYRTTAEILDATEPMLARIAPDQRLSRSIRHGEHPIDIPVTVGDVDRLLANLIARLKDRHPEELVGVIAAAERAARVAGGTQPSDATVVAASDARGLEFDTVIIVDPVEIEHASPAGLRDLYVAQTRATRRLITLRRSGQPTPMQNSQQK